MMGRMKIIVCEKARVGEMEGRLRAAGLDVENASAIFYGSLEAEHVEFVGIDPPPVRFLRFRLDAPEEGPSHPPQWEGNGRSCWFTRDLAAFRVDPQHAAR